MRTRQKGIVTSGELSDFISFSTVFKSYQQDGWVLMKDCVQWNPVYDYKGPRLNELEPGVHQVSAYPTELPGLELRTLWCSQFSLIGNAVSISILVRCYDARKLSVPGRITNLNNNKTRAYCTCSGCGEMFEKFFL